MLQDVLKQGLQFVKETSLSTVNKNKKTQIISEKEDNKHLRSLKAILLKEISNSIYYLGVRVTLEWIFTPVPPRPR